MTDFTLINAEGFEPFILPARHDPVPIAMVNRAPHGSEYCAMRHSAMFLTNIQLLDMRTWMYRRTSRGSQVSGSRRRASSCMSTLLLLTTPSNSNSPAKHRTSTPLK